uniref:von Hippel-Lindau disease tumour suppressor beta domain-containing protein n=1 Tax=Aceria tosichella TaxID=561515 RepID=A0A6G1S8G4_9ACAR
MDEDSQQKKENKPFYDLHLDLRSIKTDLRPESDCFVRFHNCTNKDITPYWINFSGKPVKYPTIKRGLSLTFNTYVNHLFFFKTSSNDNNDNDYDNGSRSQRQRQQQLSNKVLAIPREALDSACNATNYNYRPLHDHEDRAERLKICPMCIYVIKRYRRRPIKNPCHHYSGEARLSSSDIGIRSHTNFNPVGDLIYSCSDNTHHECHSKLRRDIYLVESFYNLRERCFLQIRGMPFALVAGARGGLPVLPGSVFRDYIEFANAYDKCKIDTD